MNNNKQMVLDLIERLPDDISLRGIARELDFIAGVQKGFEQIDCGESIALEEVEKMIDSWTTK